MATSTTSAHDPRLVGTWRAQPSLPACAIQANYAELLVFAAGGTYEGQAPTAGAFTWWDAGSWRVKSPNVLALSVANDEVVDYRFTLAGDTLAITDVKGCRVEYRRSP